MSLIELNNVSKVYNPKLEAEVRALDNVSLSIDSGEFVVVYGVSGSGKSTLLHLIGLIDYPTSGEIVFDNIQTGKLGDRKLANLRNEKIGFVLQDFGLIEYRTVFENCEVPLLFSKNKVGDSRAKVMEKLKLVGLDKLAKRKVSKLSGGQKQRVAIARAIVNEPDLILADEPTGQLDSKTKKDIIDLFIQINQQGKTVVLVTHDHEFESVAKRIIRIADGKIESEEWRNK